VAKKLQFPAQLRMARGSTRASFKRRWPGKSGDPSVTSQAALACVHRVPVVPSTYYFDVSESASTTNGMKEAMTKE